MSVRWPWVSRSTLEEVRGERDRLREANDELRDQLIRLARVRNGRPETPHEPKEREQEPIPNELMELIEGFASKSTRVRLAAQVRRQRSTGRSWESITDEFTEKLREGMR